MQDPRRYTSPQISPAKRSYPIRADIEGLRALAVLAVIANHAMPQALRGGFAGVDIFFVISGYLIGGHLLEDIQAGQLSFRVFYARRARRILPALIVMLAGVSGFGWLILSSQELVSLGRHVAAAALFANNFLLWSESGYFDVSSLSKPLLHLWSLGVEEQFYLLVPVLLWLSSRPRCASIRWMLWLTIASLMWTVARPVASFYLPDTRFWELGAGVVLAHIELSTAELYRSGRAASRARSREWLAIGVLLTLTAALSFALSARRGEQLQELLCGLCSLLLLSVAVIVLATTQHEPAGRSLLSAVQRYQSRVRGVGAIAGALCIGVSLGCLSSDGWPGSETLLPVLGTALVIAAGLTTRVNRLLAWRPVAFVGGISYPLYLWHWPAIVYWRMLDTDNTTRGYLLPLGVAFGLACLTKYLIEVPIRFGRLWHRPVRKAPLWSVAAGLSAMGLVGVSAIASGGYPQRFPPGLSAIANWSAPHPDVPWRVYRCYFYPNDSTPFATECTPPRRAGVPQVALWGDSHAADLYAGLAAMQGRSDFDIVQWTSAGCAPTRWPLAQEVRLCGVRRATVLRQLPRLIPETVIVAGAWELYLQNDSSRDNVLAATRDSILWLQHAGVRHVVLFGPGPIWDPSLPVALFRYMSLHRTTHIPDRLGKPAYVVRQLDTDMAAQAAAMRISYVSLLRRLCNAQGCRTLASPEVAGEGRPDLLFRDRDHLTVSGSHLVIESAVREIFPNAETAAPQ